mmetsp:Transcript_7960/g.35153  ORF Transcript_7960/g.35153 Transcript_7960/m.35153 type:complete len:256 (+) Transcript_7960:3399-4166(+)
MFATECSKPRVTKAVMGQKMARTLPATDVEAIVPHTARQTSQLHKIPLHNATPKERDTLEVAMPTTAALAAGAEAVLAPKAKYAITMEPMKLPAYERSQLRKSAPASILFARRPEHIVMTFPVNNSAPVRITSVSPAGRPTAPLRKLHSPGFAVASAGDDAPTHDMSKAPMPMRAPAEKPRTRVVLRSCAAFFSAVARTALKTAGGGSASPCGTTFATTVRHFLLDATFTGVFGAVRSLPGDMAEGRAGCRRFVM